MTISKSKSAPKAAVSPKGKGRKSDAGKSNKRGGPTTKVHKVRTKAETAAAKQYADEYYQNGNGGDLYAYICNKFINSNPAVSSDRYTTLCTEKNLKNLVYRPTEADILKARQKALRGGPS
jgi:hypothetical protein